MRFMMLMFPGGYEQAEPGTMPDPAQVAKMMKFNEALRQAGMLLALDGLHPPSAGARVSFRGGRPAVTRGPFPGAGETVGGYGMIRAPSLDAALAWAQRCPAGEREVIEIRKVHAFEEFPADVQAAVAKPGA